MAETMRVAILAVSLRFLRDDEITFADGHFDTVITSGGMRDDVWVEPERRYAIGTFLNRCGLPASWKLVSSTHSAVWIDYPTGTLRIAFTSDEFPETTIGAMPPLINVTLQRSDDGRVTMHSYSLFG